MKWQKQIYDPDREIHYCKRNGRRATVERGTVTAVWYAVVEQRRGSPLLGQFAALQDAQAFAEREL